MCFYASGGMLVWLTLLWVFCSTVTAAASNDTALLTSQILLDPFPYDFPQQGQPTTNLFPMKICHGLKLEEATIDQLQQWLSSRKMTSQELLQCYIQRIDQIDGYTKYV